MRISNELRSMLRTIGNAAIGVGLGLAVLGAGFVISQLAVGSSVAVETATPTRASTTAPTAVQASASPAPTRTNTPTSAPTLAPTTAPSPTATPGPLVATAYTSGGKRYAALRAPIGYVYNAPFAGTVQVRLYQLIDGEVRVGSNVPSLPFFPYVTVSSSDRRVIYRPGALNTDTELLVEDGIQIAPGRALFRTTGDGASSWRTFYDPGVTAHVIASLASLPGDVELDPVPFFARQ